MARSNHSFLWGAATSAHQTEGHNIHNDWWEWEKKNPRVVKSGVASDSWSRWREDLALAKSLGHTAYRFSIEWSRIEPQPGQFNSQAMSHYKDILEELRRLEMKSFVTLHHFTNPAWLAGDGGWVAWRAPEFFGRYVAYVAQHLGELVDFWIPINEPTVYAGQAYWHGVWPPQERSLLHSWWVLRQLAYGHKLAYRTIHRYFPHAQVGGAHNLMAFVPASASGLDQLAVDVSSWRYNHAFFSLTGNTHDFIGVNYYRPVWLQASAFPPRVKEIKKTGTYSDMDWMVYPEGLTQVLLEMKKYRLPIYITENGLADAVDSRRADFIRSHLRAVEEAQRQGVDICGYLHWSLIDNFEWDKGFGPRFGLIEVDYATQKRTIRPSAYVYKAIIEQARK
ncbi:MAG: glycoside hydrolase family 1 protein [Candidatus Andersenbacteria bacterium]|nr:glycoside hydrolase family 1 protein [Candidatus Andersenbacteria bacterium]